MAANPELKRASQALARASRTRPKSRWSRSTIARRWRGSARTRSTGSRSRRARCSTSSCRSARRTACTRRATSSRRSCRTRLLLPLAIAGVVAPRRPPARRRPGLWLLLAAAIVVCLVFFPQERFRIPVIDPALIVCAARRLGDRHVRPRRRMTLLVVLPTYNERPNLERVTRGDPAPSRSRGCSSSTTRRRTARARSPTSWRRESRGRIEVLHRTGPRGLGLRVHRRPAPRARDRRRRDRPDGRRPLARSEVPAGSRRRARALRPRDRIALSARRQRRELAAPPHRAQRVRESLHPARHRAVARTTARAGSASGGARRWRRCRSTTRAPNGYAFLTEMLYEAAPARLPHRRSADRLRRARTRATRRSRATSSSSRC